MTTHYRNSAGEMVEIATMAHRHAKASAAKLVRDYGTERQAEVDALNAHCRKLEAEFEAGRAHYDSVKRSADPDFDTMLWSVQQTWIAAAKKHAAGEQ